jgi:hypothetical protein
MDTISVALKEHGANGLKTRSGSREGRTHSQAAQTGATFETQKIRRDSLVLEANVVEAAGRTDDSVTEMALCLLLVFCISVSWGSFKTELSPCDPRTAGTSSSLIIIVDSITFESRCCQNSLQLTYSKVQVGQPTQHTPSLTGLTECYCRTVQGQHQFHTHIVPASLYRAGIYGTINAPNTAVSATRRYSNWNRYRDECQSSTRTGTCYTPQLFSAFHSAVCPREMHPHRVPVAWIGQADHTDTLW